MYNAIVFIFDVAIGAGVIMGISLLIRAIYLKATKKQGGNKTVRVIVITAVAVSLIMALNSIVLDAMRSNDTPVKVTANNSVVEQLEDRKAEMQAEGTPTTTVPDSTTEMTSDQINEIAAEMAWNDQTSSDQAAMCASWNMDPSVAIGIWQSQELDADLVREMGKMLDRNCSTI